MSISHITCNGSNDGVICLDNMQVPTLPATIIITNILTNTLITAAPSVFPVGATLTPGVGITTETDTNGKYCWDNLPPGKYTISVSDDSSPNVCTTTVTVDVTEPDSLSVDYEIIPGPCGDSNVTINAILPYGPVTKTNGIFKNVPTDSVNDYTLTITDSKGCSTFVLFKAESSNNLVVNTGKKDANCFDSCDGEITVVASGGTPPYKFVIYDLPRDYLATSSCEEHCADTFTFTGLCAERYVIEVTDSNGCKITYPEPPGFITINQPTEIILGPLNVVNVTCNQCCDGSITIPSILGGTPNYTVELTKFPEDMIVPSTVYTDGTNPVTLNGLQPGNYEVTVTDADGCTKVVKFGINSPSEIVINV